MILSLLAVVSLVLVSAGHGYSQDAVQSHDHTVQSDTCLTPDSDDHGGGNSPTHENCSTQSCPYCFPLEEVHSKVLQVASVDFSHALKTWRSISSLPFKRPPRTTA